MTSARSVQSVATYTERNAIFQNRFKRFGFANEMCIGEDRTEYINIKYMNFGHQVLNCQPTLYAGLI